MSATRCPLDGAHCEPSLTEEDFVSLIHRTLDCQAKLAKMAPSNGESLSLVVALMMMTVQTAIDICLREGTEPRLDGILDLCRDSYTKIIETQSLIT